jgi:glycerol kinase
MTRESIDFWDVGLTSKDVLGFSIPISGIAGDQQASLFGQMCIEPGDIKNTYGTGCFCMMNTGEKVVKSKHKMLSTIAYQLNDKTFYAIEGSVFTGGALVQWLRDELGIISNASEIESLALTVENSGGITFISGLSGLGAPHWNPDASGSILGINRGTKKGHIARAALEAIAIRTYEIIICMEKDANTKFTSLKVDGGGSNNDLLMQIQSDLLKTKVVRSSFSESTALGVAFLAGLASGYWDSVDDLKNIWKKDKEFIPDNSKNDNILSKWKERMDILY